jgi:hypothetical protein
MTHDQPTAGQKTYMLGVPPPVGTKVKEVPWGIQTQPYWLVKTHWPAGAASCTATSSPVAASTVVGGGGVQVGAGSVGSTPRGVSSATGCDGEAASAMASATAAGKVFMASPG